METKINKIIDRDLLIGWKEISSYVGKTSVTLYNWSKILKLPLMKTAARTGGTVIVEKSTITWWLLKIHEIRSNKSKITE